MANAPISPAIKAAYLNEHLTKTTHDLGFAIDDLTQALACADAVVAIVITSVLRETREALNTVKRLQTAIESKE